MIYLVSAWAVLNVYNALTAASVREFVLGMGLLLICFGGICAVLAA